LQTKIKQDWYILYTLKVDGLWLKLTPHKKLWEQALSALNPNHQSFGAQALIILKKHVDNNDMVVFFIFTRRVESKRADSLMMFLANFMVSNK